MKTQRIVNPELRALIAYRIRELRKTAGLKESLQRGYESVPLGQLPSNSSLKSILLAAIQGYRAVQYEKTGNACYVEVPDFVCEAIERDEDAYEFNLGPVLEAAEILGLDLATIGLTCADAEGTEGPTPGTTYVRLSFDLPASDETYAQQIHAIWKAHKIRSLQTEADRAAYAMYLELRKRFE